MHFPRVAVKTTTNDFRRDEIFHRASERAQNGSLELCMFESGSRCVRVTFEMFISSPPASASRGSIS